MTVNSNRQVATVLTACGIETQERQSLADKKDSKVATVLTACGIETVRLTENNPENLEMLQQYLPLAVLKLYEPPTC